MASLLSILLYSIAWACSLVSLVQRNSLSKANWLLPMVGAGVICHSLAAYHSIVGEDGLQLGIFKVTSLFFLVINLLALVSSLRTPLHNLFLLLLPPSIGGLALAEVFDTPITDGQALSPGMVSHILLSILAYSLLAMATVQALLLGYQQKQLRTKQFHGVMGIMPPLQTMERLLFDMVWAGFGLLTLSIITGVLFISDILAQQLSHKTLFSLLSWLVYGILLGGHQMYGWRGPAAVKWVIGGFVALVVAYFGSKLVLEVILA